MAKRESNGGKPSAPRALRLGPRLCCSSFTSIGRVVKMAKKSSVSSRPARLVSMTSEDIKKRKWSEAEKRTLRLLAARQAAGDDSNIDYSDIPPLTDEQLAGMVRFRDRQKTTMISLRVREDVLAWLKSKGPGHLTRVNDILTNVMEAEKRLGR